MSDSLFRSLPKRAPKNESLFRSFKKTAKEQIALPLFLIKKEGFALFQKERLPNPGYKSFYRKTSLLDILKAVIQISLLSEIWQQKIKTL